MKLITPIYGVYPINTRCKTVLFPVSIFAQWVKIETYDFLIFPMFLALHRVKYKYQFMRWILMKKLVIEFPNDRLITPSGLSFVGQLLGKSNFIKKCNNMKVDGKRSRSQIKNGDILLFYIGILCQGKTSYDAINEMSDAPEYYRLALGITRAIPYGPIWAGAMMIS